MDDSQITTLGAPYTHGAYIQENGEKEAKYMLMVERAEDRNEFGFSHMEGVLRLALCQHQGIPPPENQQRTSFPPTSVKFGKQSVSDICSSYHPKQ